MHDLSDEEMEVFEEFWGYGPDYEHLGQAEVRIFYLLRSDLTTHSKIRELKAEFFRFMVHLKGEEW